MFKMSTLANTRTCSRLRYFTASSVTFYGKADQINLSAALNSLALVAACDKTLANLIVY